MGGGVALFLLLSGYGSVAGGALLAVTLASALLPGNYWASPIATVAMGRPLNLLFGAASGVAVLSLFAFWFPSFQLSASLILVSAGVALATASALEAIGQQSTAHRKRVIIVGAADGGSELAAALQDRAFPAVEYVGLIPEAAVGEDAAQDVRQHLHAALSRSRPDIVVLAGPSRARTIEHLLDGDRVDFRVVGVPAFWEHAFGRVPIENLSPEWFMSIVHLYQQRYSRATKRAFDLVVAGSALVLAAPLLLAVGLLVRCSSPGPVIYRQIRLGEAGKPFAIAKFRTMVHGAEQPGEPVWAQERDPRITRVGRFLRRTRLDELPQLLNVLAGDMSIVGPRPERPEFFDVLRKSVPFWTRRHLVKPGITGWAQVCSGYASDVTGTAEKLSYDLYYLRHRSLLLDLMICAKTARIVFSGIGAR